MNAKQLKSLKKVIDYLASEKKDWELSGCPKRHIYNDIAVLQSFWQANTGVEADVALWRCRNCHSENPHGYSRCLTCGNRAAVHA